MGFALPPTFDSSTTTTQPAFDTTTGTNQQAKLAAGITSADTLRPFVEVDKHNLFHYEANSGHPTLASLGQTLLSPIQEQEDNAWQEIAESLIQAAPPAIQEKLGALRNLAIEERNNQSFENFESWNALDKVIMVVSQTVAFITGVHSLSQTEAAKNAAALNSESVSAISSSMADQAQELAESVKEQLKKKLNDPEYDACNYLISQLQTFIPELNTPSNPLKAT